MIGRTIVNTRLLTEVEMSALGWWGEPSLVLELDDGSLLFASRDPEGNGPGALYGAGPDRGVFILTNEEA